MDNQEAREILSAELARWRSKSWIDLSALVGESRHVDGAGQGEAEYQVEIEVMWDHRPEGDIRVLASIDDGGWRAFSPLTDSFILSPTGEFVGED